MGIASTRIFIGKLAGIILLAIVLTSFGFVNSAQGIFVGGFNAAMIPCSCGPGHMAIIVGVPGSPSGPYYFGPGVQYWVGSGMPGAFFLANISGMSSCMMGASPYCWAWLGQNVTQYGGSS